MVSRPIGAKEPAWVRTLTPIVYMAEAPCPEACTDVRQGWAKAPRDAQHCWLHSCRAGACSAFEHCAQPICEVDIELQFSMIQSIMPFAG